MDNLMLESEQIEYPRLHPMYFVVCGVSFIVITAMIITNCRRRNVGHNRLRREYTV